MAGAGERETSEMKRLVICLRGERHDRSEGIIDATRTIESHDEIARVIGGREIDHDRQAAIGKQRTPVRARSVM